MGSRTLKLTMRKTPYVNLTLAGLILLMTCGCSPVFSKRPVGETADVELRESGEWRFASTKAEDKGQTRGFAWGRIKNEDRQIILWLPDDKIFKRLVKDGVFPGKLDGDDLILDELKPQHLEIITSGERGVLFEWDKPAVFVKVGN